MAALLPKFPGVAFITGAGGTGIGAAVARAFAKSGCSQFAITDINRDSLARTRDDIMRINPKAHITSHAGDVSDEHFVDSLMAEVTKTFRRVDYAVNCAGILGNNLRSSETPVRSFDAITNVNYKGTWLTSRAALAQMLNQEPLAEHPGQRGAVVNIASQLGIVARPGAGQSPCDSDLAATAPAVSLPSMSVGHWTAQQPQTSGQTNVANNSHCVGRGQGEEPQPHHQELLSPQLFESEQDITGCDQFKEFASFLDGIGLPAEWSPYFHPPERDYELLDPPQQDSGTTAGTPPGRPSTSRPGTPFSSWLPSAPEANRIPANLTERARRPIEIGCRVTDDQREELNIALEASRDVVGPDFKLPSRHTLTRYLTSFFEGFHSHMVFIHHTWRVSEAPLELVLALSAVGAQYCFEHRNSERLFYAGKAILMERLRQEAGKSGCETNAFLNLGSLNRPPDNRSSPRNILSGLERGPRKWEVMDSVRTLIVLMGYATWEPKEVLLREAFALQSLLVQVLRDIGLEEEPEPDESVASDMEPHAEWLAWVRQESTRRAKLIAFSFLHIHSVAYNIYPVLRSNEIRLRLPCSTGEWRAPTAAHWQTAGREIRKEQLLFQDALSLLLRNFDSTAPLDPIPTPLGNYVLLHGLLQRIYIVRDLSLPFTDQSASLPEDEVEKLERGLRSWTSGWQQAPESSLDPNNENGPIPFTSSALLGLAYVRIYLDIGPYRLLETRDPVRVAKALYRCPGVQHCDGVISALLYAVHALSIPVRLGLDRVARSQAFFWSVRHSLSGLECAVLLSKWLFSLVGRGGAAQLSDSEDRILRWVRCIVEEAWAAVDFEDDEPEFRSDPGSLGLAVLKIWARLFKGNTQWRFINMIGLSLEKYREMLIKSADGRLGIE
ncbi:related to regulatory protein amdA [Cephalotrichum gorgonifer]|uniref:Related to regulatory protein amdA n=1 Tax=Cephalotrichum gorgonifer TaxID=2041049 RepID=A0AAE8MTC0_9PEZI|nr:related to regulatory protein amdA [Cephalotrichum gorgonifer]